MNGKQQRPFVYGTFRWPAKGGTLGRLPPPPNTQPGADIAVEILREFGPNELIGKVYVRPFSGPWTPAQWDRVGDWYPAYQRFPKAFVFDMAGSGVWDVLHFRSESDETGPYVAVALRYAPTVSPWIAKQREQELT
jgi:hypothetical protein